MNSSRKATCSKRWRRPISSATSRRTILFDLDGTLTDPKQGITRCIAHALQILDVPVPNMEILTSWIGPPIQDSFRDILPDNSPTAIARAVGLFRDRFATVGIFENEVYAGIPNALETLISSGHRLVLATSKPEPFAVRILEHFDLANYFTSVYGSSFDGSLSDKGELIAHALVQEALDPAAAVMVGDRKHDVLGAAKCGIPCVGVLYGYGSQQELQEAGAALLCETPADLPVVLQDATHLDAIWEPDRHSRY